MKRVLLSVLALAALLAPGGESATGFGPLVRVNTPTGTLLTLKTSELAILPQQSVTQPIDGVSTLEQGPTLASLLSLAGVQYNAACRNDELRW